MTTGTERMTRRTGAKEANDAKERDDAKARAKASTAKAAKAKALGLSFPRPLSAKAKDTKARARVKDAARNGPVLSRLLRRKDRLSFRRC